MGKHLQTLLCAALAFVCLGAKAEDVSVSKVGEYKLWNFSDLTASTTISAHQSLDGYLATYVYTGSSTYSDKVNSTALNKFSYTGTFSDGRTWLTTNDNVIYISKGDGGSTKLMEALKRLTSYNGASTYLKGGYLAFDTSVPGTCYVKFRRASSSAKTVNLAFQKAEATSEDKGISSVSVSADNTYTDLQELSLKKDSAGTFYINSTGPINIYAIQFVPSVAVTIGETGYASYTPTSGENLLLPEGLTAFAATSSDDSKVSFTSVDAMVSGNGYLLKGTANTTYYMTPVLTSYDAPTPNLMQGVTSDVTIGGNNTDYILVNNSGTAAFQKAESGTIYAGKAYLKLTTTDNAKQVLSIDFGEVTGISSVVADAKTADSQATYDLRGQKVGAGYKGLVIKNGKKYFVK